LALLIGVYFAWYAISQRRWRILFWMVGSVAMLTLITSLMVPDWLIQNLREVLLYPSYNPPGTPGAAFAVYMPAVGKQVGWILTFILAVMLLLEWLGSLRREFRAFLWTGCLTLVVSAWSGIQTDPGNFILLILPLTLVFSIWCGRWKTTGVALTLVSMALVFFGIWGLFLVTVDPVYQPIQSPLMFFPLPAFLLAGLYWVRWWAIQPPSLWLDLLVETEEM
jgi:hypothetical protein